MVHVYAIEPDLVATWYDQKSFNFYATAFGLGTPRILARLPERWVEMVLRRSKAPTEMDKKRLEVLATAMNEVVARRPPTEYDVGAPWRCNVDEASRHAPFDLILDTNNFDAEVARTSENKWFVPTAIVVSRTSDNLAASIRSMLAFSSRITFIDPYFNPLENRFLLPLKQFTSIARSYCRPNEQQIEIHTSASRNDVLPWPEFETHCKDRLPPVFANNQKVRVVRWAHRPGGERLHNRYVLTNLGGVQFGKGLDESTAADSDDLSLLSRPAYEKRWSDYMGPLFAYDQINAVEIEGAAAK